MNECDAQDAGATLPLFRAYPGLGRLPYVALGEFPTPVERLAGVGGELGLAQLYIKRDDLSAGLYGGNKVRKLEFLLGEARRTGAREVITIGFAGSNHALATALHARRLGLRCASMLLPQAGADYVRRNLLAGRQCGAELCAYRNFTSLTCGIVFKMIKGRLRDGAWPLYIPPGGSCPLGVTGYVNAALELRDQIAAGMMPEPDRIYVPMGSMGTAAGLALGLRAAGLRTQVAAIRVIEEKLASVAGMRKLFEKTSELLCRHDPAFPRVRFSEDALVIRNEFLGEGYARKTELSARAAELMQRQTGIPMNIAYSAKAFGALMNDAAREEGLKGKAVLFWNTFNSRDLEPLIKDADYRQLPQAFRCYFEEDVLAFDMK